MDSCLDVQQSNGDVTRLRCDSAARLCVVDSIIRTGGSGSGSGSGGEGEGGGAVPPWLIATLVGLAILILLLAVLICCSCVTKKRLRDFVSFRPSMRSFAQRSAAATAANSGSATPLHFRTSYTNNTSKNVLFCLNLL